MESPLVQIGDRVEVHWPLDGGTTTRAFATVTKVKRCKKQKADSWFKYSLKFDDSSSQPLAGMKQKTRLVDLKWRKVKHDTAAEECSSENDVKEKKSKDKNEKKEKKKRAREDDVQTTGTSNSLNISALVNSKNQILPSHSRILAPMVGGSELAFRLLCRKYGADLAYTPMMNSERFAVEEEYRKQEFQTAPGDRPLVAHFSGNTILRAYKSGSETNLPIFTAD
jgi:Dihydrouridine synthase (Dus)